MRSSGRRARSSTPSQQETGADIAVDDDGAQGIVTIGAVEAWRMEDAKARILAIVSPPMADVGATYQGRVVNITKFGAFVNILPGRDGLVHISKLGKGKRINNVEDVLTLGQEIEVIVEEIDEKGKVSLTPGDAGTRSSPKAQAPPAAGDRDRGDRAAIATVARRPWQRPWQRSWRRRASAPAAARPSMARSPCRSTTRSTPNSPASSATSAPVAKPAATPVAIAWRRPRWRPPSRHR